jgi:hypothetical protein
MDVREIRRRMTKTNIGWIAFLVTCLLIVAVSVLAVTVEVLAGLSGEM